MRPVIGFLSAMLLTATLFITCQAQVSGLLPFQGQLTDQFGQPLNSATALTLVVRLYENPVGGTVSWEEIHPNVQALAGRFTILLGSRNPFPNAKLFEKTVYLGITIDDGNAATADIEMRPRQAVVPTIFATNASNAEKLAGHDWADLLVSGNDPSAGLIRANKIEPKLLEELEKRVADLQQSLQTLTLKVEREQTVGTIVSSYLNWEEYAAVTKNNGEDLGANIWSPTVSKWAPVDGRSVAGSKLALLTQQTKLPDLRGVFLRGLNSFDPTGEGVPVDNSRKDPQNRTRGHYQPDTFGKHDHGGGDHRHKTGIWNGAATNFGGPVFRTNADQNIDNDTAWTKPSGAIIETEGGAETRPKNIAIYYYIRIN